MGFVSRHTRLHKLSCGNKSLCSYLWGNRCLNVHFRDQCSCETYLLALQCRKTGTANLCLNKQNLPVLRKEGNVFPPKFQKAGFEAGIRGGSNGKKNAPPLWLSWTKGEAALSHSAPANRGRDRTTRLHRCHPQSNTCSLPKYWTAWVIERK